MGNGHASLFASLGGTDRPVRFAVAPLAASDFLVSALCRWTLLVIRDFAVFCALLNQPILMDILIDMNIFS